MSNPYPSEQEYPTDDNINDLDNDAVETHEVNHSELEAEPSNLVEVDADNSLPSEAFAEEDSLSDNQDMQSYDTESETVSEVIDIAPESETIPEDELTVSTPIDITILGEQYTINCPVGEEDELSEATVYINEFVNEIREAAPQLSAKNLLVLSCLNLYDKMQKATSAAAVDSETLQQANHLIDQMIEDMQLTDD